MKAFYSNIKEAIKDWISDGAMNLSAALSLYAILSLAPLVVLTIKVVGIVWRGKDFARDQIMLQMTSLMGANAAQAIRPILDNSARPGSGIVATVVSMAVLLFSATGVFAQLQESMNVIWHVKAKPHSGIWDFVRRRLLSMTMVFGIAFLLLVSMFISTALSVAAKYIAGDAKWLFFLVDAATSLIVVSILFAAIFKFLPDVKLRWKHVWLGAIITAGLFTIGKHAMAVYFRCAAPTSAFGAAGSLAAVLLWVYYSSFILFFGAEFTKVWVNHHVGHVEPEGHAYPAGIPNK